MRLAKIQTVFGILVFLAVGARIAPVIAQNTQASKHAEIDGIWAGDSLVRDGQSRQLKAGEVRLTFRGPTMKAVGLAGPQEIELKCSTDPSTSPKQLDYGLADGPTVKAIYSIEGSVLTVAIPKPGGPRPTSLTSSPGSGLTVFKLSRSTGGGN